MWRPRGLSVQQSARTPRLFVCCKVYSAKFCCFRGDEAAAETGASVRGLRCPSWRARRSPPVGLGRYDSGRDGAFRESGKRFSLWSVWRHLCSCSGDLVALSLRRCVQPARSRRRDALGPACLSTVCVLRRASFLPASGLNPLACLCPPRTRQQQQRSASPSSLPREDAANFSVPFAFRGAAAFPSTPGSFRGLSSPAPAASVGRASLAAALASRRFSASL